jgi:hypothetical protein
MTRASLHVLYTVRNRYAKEHLFRAATQNARLRQQPMGRHPARSTGQRPTKIIMSAQALSITSPSWSDLSIRNSQELCTFRECAVSPLSSAKDPSPPSTPANAPSPSPQSAKAPSPRPLQPNASFFTALSCSECAPPECCHPRAIRKPALRTPAKDKRIDLTWRVGFV